MSFSEFPKAMTHPGYRPAVLSKDEVDSHGRLIKKAAPGSGVRFPPVYVNNHDQELEYASRGYVPNGTSDPEAYRRSAAGADIPNEHKHIEFPKWLYRMVEDELESKLVKDQAAQDLLRGAWFATPGDAQASIEEDEDEQPAVEVRNAAAGKAPRRSTKPVEETQPTE